MLAIKVPADVMQMGMADAQDQDALQMHRCHDFQLMLRVQKELCMISVSIELSFLSCLETAAFLVAC